jgi:multidrug transporter EmrE-like cation transporter
MIGFFGITVLFGSVLVTVVADVLLKKYGESGGFWATVFSPWMIIICVLYFVQIILALYIFVHKADLAIYGNIFVVFYSILMVMLGILIFKEHLTLWQSVGIALALGGIVLLNSGL